MVNNRGALEINTSVESGIQSANVVVNNTEMRNFQQSDLRQSNTASQHLNPLEIVDDLSKRPVPVTDYSPANFARNQFKLLDKDGNGYIKDDEIKAYQERFKDFLTPRMQEHLEELKKNYSSTLSLSNDEFGFERSGMTMKDLAVLRDREEGAEAAVHIKELVDNHFNDIDTDRNGKITTAEIKSYKEANVMDHPVRDRTALTVLETLSTGTNFAVATGDFFGQFNYFASGSGLTREQSLQAADLVKTQGVQASTEWLSNSRNGNGRSNDNSY